MQKTLTLAKEVEHALQSKHWKYYLEKLFGNKPKHWDDTLDGRKRLRFIVNALTRMRMCKPNGNLDFDHKGPPETTENSLPWFEVNPRAASSHTIIFGHWSALGLLLRPNLIGLDTGCVWGRQLTAVRLYNRQTISIDCKKL